MIELADAPLTLETCREAAWLKPTVKLEPLMDRWPLWPHLLPPAQYAMNLAGRLLPLLRSFVANPDVHAQASLDPMLFGGPFVTLGRGDVAAAQRYLEDLEATSTDLLAFARDLKALDRALDSADGFSLDAFYADLPPTIGGLVELVYDLKSHPRIRLMEELAYDALRRRRGQGFCLHAVDDRERLFFMNTPLLDAPGRLFLDLPYADARVEALARARLTAGIAPEILAFLAGPGAPPLDTFFTLRSPTRKAPTFHGEGVRVRYFGHACVLLQTATTSVLIDPAVAWQRDDGLASLTYDDLPDRIDAVVISHAHQDHLLAELLLQLRGRIGKIIVPPNDRGNLADPSMRLMLRELGFDNVQTLAPFEQVDFADGAVMSLPFVGEHGGLDIASKQAVLVTLKGRKLMFMVDSDGVDPRLSQRIAERVGPIDILFLGMECEGAPGSWLYGPLFSRPLSRANDQSRRFSGSDCERAWSAVWELGCRRAYVYAMGQEPWMRHLMGLEYTPDSVQLKEADRFLERCRAAGIQAQRLYGAQEEVLPPA